MRTGGCLCGAVRYQVTGPLRDVVVCHCSRCLRTHGHAAAYSACAATDLALVSDESLRWYEADGRARGFCGRCGASLFWRADERETISVAAGTLDQPTGLETIAHIYTRDHADYYSIDGPGERYPGPLQDRQSPSRDPYDDRVATAVPLTSLSHGAGCGCKLPAAAIAPIVTGLPRSADPRLLVGSETADDAGVIRVTDDLALVQTVDFFTPIVDDPYDFGRIAAANALSDVYAMGGTPISALNLVAFPLERLGADVLVEILRGGAEVVEEAGALLVGGHSIDDPEPKYGLAVTGTVHPAELVTNAGGQPGDLLVLSKPLGVGAITTALKRGAAGREHLAPAVEAMTTLNAAAAAAARAAGVHAMTDVTGFGLLGHLHELTEASGLAAEVAADAVPALPGVEELLRGDHAVAGGSRRNRAHAETFATFAAGVPEWRRRLVCDATTSGGLLAAVPPGAERLVPGTVVGRLTAGAPGTIAVR